MDSEDSNRPIGNDYVDNLPVFTATIMDKDWIIGNVYNVSSKIVWEIVEFVRYCKNVGKRVFSPEFVVLSVNSNVRWRLVLYPRGGILHNCTDFLALFLRTTEKVEATIELKILSSNGEEVVNYNMVKYTFEPDKLHGSRGLISKDVVLNPANGILHNGNLVIVCQISMPAYTLKEIKPQELEQETADLSRLKVLDTYEGLLNDGKYSDVTLVAEGNAIQAHKCVLAKFSPVFAAMFEAQVRQQALGSPIQIPDIAYPVLVELIRFVYSGKVNNIDAMVVELAIAAQRFSLFGLKATCEKAIIRRLNADNAVSCVLLAEKHGMVALGEKAVEVIVENTDDVAKSMMFKFLPPHIIRKISDGTWKKANNGQ